jgi:2-oxoglutarate ferredoxin oxidoreductase subunit beta
MTDIPIQDIPTYTRKDFMSDQTVRWCPGCGDYAILAAVQKVLPELGIRRENIVFISGIGCSSRFPYYMNTYGIHSIHGRAPTLATGLKIANPELSVWVVTGDGDGLSIGGNHLLHACRRNIDLKILLFNNRIYGLTKGQYSPTSLPGHKTKSSPMGSIEQAFNPLAVALGAEATFVARSLDVNTHHMNEVLHAAATHKGASFIEIFQNCLIFNDGAWDHVSDKTVADEHSLFLKHGEPMIFGKNKDKGIRLNGLRPEVVQLGGGVTESDLLVHDQTDANLAYLIARMPYPEFPVPLGVIYGVEKPTYEAQLMGQVHTAQQKSAPDLAALYMADDTWVVEAGETRSTDTSEMLAVGSMDEEYIDTLEQTLSGNGANGKTEIHESLASDPLSNLDYSSRKDVLVPADLTLAQAIQRMQDLNEGALLVVTADGRPVGIFTERDILAKVATQIDHLELHLIADYMTPNPDVLPASAPIAHALHLMAVHHYRHVPVVNDEGVALGVVSFRDVVRYIETWFDR